MSKPNHAIADLKYLSGFGNSFESEALSGALPKNQNSPQKPAFGLYSEQLSGTAFTVKQEENRRSWLYRILPSVKHGRFQKIENGLIRGTPFNDAPAGPNQLRWNPLPDPKEKTDFIQGLVTMAGNGSIDGGFGCAVHLYSANQSMTKSYFFNADGELLIVPQEGELLVLTEFGRIHVKPSEVCVIPRGVKFQIKLLNEKAKGYVGENFGSFVRLPALGPIGANGLAAPRHFLAPTAWYEDRQESLKLIAKSQGQLWESDLESSPLDVVAWHGNYYPYKYDLKLFNTINTVSFDHPDPSIFTVLTSPSDTNGVANIDFVIFPPRWMVAEQTFRPPYYHRNIMSEWMGLIYGVYDAKQEGFTPGGSSLHNQLSAHGPDAATFEKATQSELTPQFIKNTLAFMFESRYPFVPTRFAMEGGLLQENYLEAWRSLNRYFKGANE